MSNPLLPATTKKHFHLKVSSPEEGFIVDFCTNGLLIPREHLAQYDRALGLDAFYVYVRSGQRFLVSGQELEEWEARKKHPLCIPGRDEVVYDQ